MKLGVWLALLGLVLGGCSSAFYLTDYDVASYTQQLGTEQGANDTLAPWRGAVVQVDFAMVGGVPQISSSNLGQVFRERGAFRFTPEMMDRAAAEVRRELGTWLGPELSRLADRFGARLTALRRIRLEILDPPTFTFREGIGEIEFSLRVRATVRGALYLPDPVDRHFPTVSLDVNDYRLTGTLALGTAHPQGAMIRLRATPKPGAINVSILDERIRDEIVDRLGAPLSARVDVSRPLSYERFAVPELRLRREPSSGGAPPLRLRSTYFARPDAPEPVLHAVWRSASGILSHARRERGVWTSFSAVSTHALAAADPAMVGSGADRLDAVTVDGAGGLRHVRFRDGDWSEQPVPDLGPTGRLEARRPALLATAPGQLEVVAMASDGRLQHVRRIDGRWQASGAVPLRGATVAPPLRDPALAQSGGKMVLLFVDRLARLFAMVFDLETGHWGIIQQIPDHGVRGALTTAACGDGRVDLAYVSAAHGSVVHQTLSATLDPFRADEGSAGLSVSTWSLVSGTTPSNDPSLVCSGFRRLELLVPGRDQQLFHNHYARTAGEVDGRSFRPGWQGWQPVGQPLIRSGVTPFVRMAAPVATAVSSTGQVYVLGAGWVGRPDGVRSTFHNSFLAQRWGRAPWASAQWRGWDGITGAALEGRPALAVTDRHAELLVVGSDLGLRRALVGDRVPARFTGGPAVGRARHQAEPVGLISGPGTLDVLYLDDDHRLHHVRVLDGELPINVRVDERPAIVSIARPAVAVVGGQLEVVALGTDRALKHWRYRLGQWEVGPAIPDATQVVAPPALVNGGAGRLDLLALSSGGRVYRWRFAGGQWSPGRELGGEFRVSATAFNARAVSSWGDGTIDLVLAEDGTGRLFHHHVPAREAILIHRGSATISPDFTPLGGPAAGTVAIAALGPSRVMVLGETLTGRPFTAWSAPAPPRHEGGLLVWQSQLLVGPVVEVTGLVSIGPHEVLASAVDHAGKLYLNRFFGWRWAGYAPLYGQTPQTRSSPPVPPSLAAP